MTLRERMLWIGGYGGLLLLAFTGIAFGSGYWGILLALGPTIYPLVLDAHGAENTPKRVAISYSAALVIGWSSYMMIAQGVEPTSIEPMSEAGGRLVGSAFVSSAGTMGVLYVMNSNQSVVFIPGFIAALGLFSTIQSLVSALIVVFFLSSIHAFRRRVGPEFTISPSSINDHSTGG